MKDDYTTNSHYLTYTFILKGDGRMYFLSLGVKALNRYTGAAPCSGYSPNQADQFVDMICLNSTHSKYGSTEHSSLPD